MSLLRRECGGGTRVGRAKEALLCAQIAGEEVSDFTGVVRSALYDPT